LHGKNRLGGNALTECVVFGRIIGENIEIRNPNKKSASNLHDINNKERNSIDVKLMKINELSIHNDPNDCLVAIEGKIYNFTNFIDGHPGGSHSIIILCGSDGTKSFSAVHSMEMLTDFSPIYSLSE